VTRAALSLALALALLPAASAVAAGPHVLRERDLPGMKASFAATHPLRTIKRFVLVYSDDRSRKRDKVELRQCGFRGGTATELFQSSASTDTTKPVAVWTSVLPPGSYAAVAATTLTGGAKASLTIVLVPRGPRVAVLTLTSQTGFNPYPEARNLMRRMLGLKPIAVPTQKPPPLGVPVETARFVRP
jgi:hypothetical protein